MIRHQSFTYSLNFRVVLMRASSSAEKPLLAFEAGASTCMGVPPLPARELGRAAGGLPAGRRGCAQAEAFLWHLTACAPSALLVCRASFAASAATEIILWRPLLRVLPKAVTSSSSEAPFTVSSSEFSHLRISDLPIFEGSATVVFLSLAAKAVMADWNMCCAKLLVAIWATRAVKSLALTGAFGAFVVLALASLPLASAALLPVPDRRPGEAGAARGHGCAAAGARDAAFAGVRTSVPSSSSSTSAVLSALGSTVTLSA
mmetsp:Transcript_65023/g.201651  ORF Transcript_65023/g.201651 Transcript_65023/m.201651 type:complete len:260 (+) Transcript_65023:1201-1980(+)